MKAIDWWTSHRRVELLADACVLSAASLVVLGAAQLALTGGFTDDIPVWLAVTAGVLATLITLAGPVATWLLHGGRPSWAATIGAALGMAAIGVVVPSLALIGAAFGWALSPFTSNEYAGPIAMLVIVSIVFLVTVIATTGQVVRSVRLRSFTRLTIARCVALGLLVIYAIGSWWFALGSEDPERGEAMIFAIVWGLTGMMLVLGADVATTWWQRRRNRALQR